MRMIVITGIRHILREAGNGHLASAHHAGQHGIPFALLIALEQTDRACDFYLQAQGFLLSVAANAEGEGMFEALEHAMGHVNAIWLDFLKKHRDHIDAGRLQRFQQGARAIDVLAPKHCVCH